MTNKEVMYTGSDVYKFDSKEELLVFNEVFRNQINGEWRHSAPTREKLAKKVGIAEITLKVMLRTLLKKQALIKKMKAVYTCNPKFLQYGLNE